MRRPLLALVPLLALLLPGGRITAQAPASDAAPTTFDVASIKRNNSGTGMISMGMRPGGRVDFVNVTLQNLILRAYQVQPFQIIGGPDWIRSDRFDVIASAGAEVPPAQLNVMLQALLADRFKLAVHTETRESDVFHLVKARDDGRLGPELKPAAVECGPAGRGRGPQPGPQAGPPPPGRGPVQAGRGGGPGCQMMMTPGRFQAAGQPMAMLANTLANFAGRPVVDRTGLTGGYDFVVSFMPEGRGAPIGPLPPGIELPPIDPNAPSLFTALQEQLGLKLESARGPMDVIVIDNVEPPTED